MGLGFRIDIPIQVIMNSTDIVALSAGFGSGGMNGLGNTESFGV